MQNEENALPEILKRKNSLGEKDGGKQWSKMYWQRSVLLLGWYSWKIEAGFPAHEPFRRSEREDAVTFKATHTVLPTCVRAHLQ